MSNLLNSETFGQKIYNRFPSMYKEDDAKENFALQRFIESLAEGGFKNAIDEINGITYLIDPSKIPSEFLSTLFKQYGLEVFNGIPETYLRYLLPKLGEAWSKKGSLSVLEFITSSLTGIRNSTLIVYDEKHNPTVELRLDMDDTLADYYFPDSNTGKFNRLLNNFVPYYCDLILIYTSLFLELEGKISGKEDGEEYIVTEDPKNDDAFLNTTIEEEYHFKSTIDEEESISTHYDSNSTTNDILSKLNGSFYTNCISAYDIIQKGSDVEIVV